MKKYSAKEKLKELDNYYPNSDLNHIYQKYREDVKTILNTIENIWKTKSLENDDFEILLKGLKNSWIGVYFYLIGKEINLMIGEVENIEEVIHKGISDRKWQTRFNTIVVMKTISHEKLKNQIIKIALQDKSKKVREMAKDVEIFH